MIEKLCRWTTVVLCLVPAMAWGQNYSTDPDRLAPPMNDGDTPIIEPRNMALWDSLGQDDAIEPTMVVNHIDDLSYDIVFRFENPDASIRPLGRISIGALALGPDVTIYDHEQDSCFRDYNYNTFQGLAWPYPGDAYSPVMIVMNQTHIIGVSLLYPVMEYKHDATVRLARLGGAFRGPDSRLGWKVAFDFNNASGISQYSSIGHEAMLYPGESREYTMSIRAMRRPATMPGVFEKQDWLEVIRPYHDYFKATYGDVMYERRTKPIYGTEIANPQAISDTNPRGMLNQALRPDRVGFAGIVNYHLSFDYNYGNILFWNPSGLFDEHPELNYPSLFTLGWLDSIPLRSALDWNAFPRVPQEGRELGFWWGRAAEHMDRWNDNESEPLDPDNPQHMSVVYQQMDLATQAGATMIGLDRFIHFEMPVWKQKPYLEDLRDRYPGVTFTTEQMTSDLMHVVAASSNRGFRVISGRTDEPSYHNIERPLYIADYLVPGHETWALWRYSDIQNNDPSQVIDSARLQRDFERIASMGYLPVAMGVPIYLPNPAGCAPHATWEQTSPSWEDSTSGDGDGDGGGSDGDTGDGGDGDSGDGDGGDGGGGDGGGSGNDGGDNGDGGGDGGGSNRGGDDGNNGGGDSGGDDSGDGSDGDSGSGDSGSGGDTGDTGGSDDGGDEGGGDSGDGDDAGGGDGADAEPDRPVRTYYITLPNGKRIKIVSR